MDDDVYTILTEPEKAVWRWLYNRKIAFEAQQRMFGGRLETGGTVADFILPNHALALRVMGVYWHASIRAQARDLISREKLTEAGYQVVDLWEDKLTEDKIENTMKLAIQGLELPR